MSRIGLFSKVVAGLGLLAAVLIASSLVGLSRLTSLDNAAEVVRRVGVTGQEPFNGLRTALGDIRTETVRHVVVPFADQGKEEAAFTKAKETALEHFGELAKVEAGIEFAAAVTDAHSAFDAYVTAVEQTLFPLSRTTKDWDALQATLETIRTHYTATSAAVDGADTALLAEVKLVHDDAANTFEQGRTMLIGLLIVGLVAAVVASVAVLRAIRTVGLSVRQVSARLSEAASELGQTSNGLAATAEETAAQSQTAASAAEQVSANSTYVANAAEELRSSAGEIASSTARAAEVANRATALAGDTSALVGQLTESSQAIGRVVELISNVAAETNLLALNATIEAARAGESGKGFAVVAAEVKDLATETTRATGEISGKITAIQGDARDASEAITRIAAVIAEINDLQTTIAGAIEEQTATTGEIGRSISEAALGVSGIASSVSGLADAARATTQDAHATKSASDRMGEMSAELERHVAVFRF